MLTLVSWAGKDHTGCLTRPNSRPIMPPRRDNELPIFTPEGTNAGGFRTTELPPSPSLPHNENGHPNREQLYTMLRDITWSLAIMSENHRATQARFNSLNAN